MRSCLRGISQCPAAMVQKGFVSRKMLCQFSLNTGNVVGILGICIIHNLHSLAEGIDIGVLDHFNAVVLDFLQSSRLLKRSRLMVMIAVE